MAGHTKRREAPCSAAGAAAPRVPSQRTTPDKAGGRNVRYLFMAYHFPRPEYRHDLLRWTQRVADALRAQPGLLQVGDFDDPANGRIVAISIWESTERFRA